MAKEITKKLIVDLPDGSTPGYLRRKIAADKFSRALRELTTSNTPLPEDFYDNLIEFLLGFVSEPTDRDEAREVLLDATEEQYRDLLTVINGKDDTNPTSPEPTEKN